jgi:inosose dehydratase
VTPRYACQTYAWQMSGERYRGEVEHMTDVVASAGFAGFEPEVFMLDGKNDPEVVRAMLRERRLELAALCLVEHWRGARESDVERQSADRAIAFTARFPEARLSLCQMPGPDREDLGGRQRNLLACVEEIARRAEDAGVACTYHTNSPPGSVFRTADDYEVLLDGLDERIGFTPDLGHIARGGMDPLEVVRTYRSRIDHLHVKDMHADGTWAPTGEGEVDVIGVCAYLRETGYEGWIVFEDESPGAQRDPDGAARPAARFAREALR